MSNDKPEISFGKFDNIYNIYFILSEVDIKNLYDHLIIIMIVL